MGWQNWPSVSFSDRDRLPKEAGIYVVADAHHFVWYVGQAVSLQARWIGRAHHRYPQLIRTDKKLEHRIYWQIVSVQELDKKERFYIEELQPELNGCKVKSYLPKQPQVDREIKRLFKTLNRTTLLFPILRSVIAGAYQDEDGVQCVVTVIYINDFRLLGKSVRKRYSKQIRQAWWALNTDCGRPQDQYHEHQIMSYHLSNQRFEFVEGSDILRYLEEHPLMYDRVVETTHLFGCEVKTLRDLSVLDEADWEEEHTFLRENKRTLKDIAYLNYIRPLLHPFSKSKML